MTNAMIFPGQGSQAVGMLGEWVESPVVQDCFAQAQEILGYDLLSLVCDGPSEQLNQTTFTQPALFVVSVAFFKLWCDSGAPMPALMAGHSLGEWSALVCAGSIDFAQALKMVKLRAELMQAAGDSRPGAMAAVIGLDGEAVASLCAQISEGMVMPANYNSPGQVVVAGDVAAVDALVAAAKPAGAKLAKKLAMSVASHCELMQDAATRFAQALADVSFNAPKIPVLHNYDVLAHDDPESIKQVLVAQLVSPVRWVEIMDEMRSRGVTQLIECGPGKVLSGLAKRMQPAIPAQTFAQAMMAMSS